MPENQTRNCIMYRQHSDRVLFQAATLQRMDVTTVLVWSQKNWILRRVSKGLVMTLSPIVQIIGLNCQHSPNFLNIHDAKI